MDNEVRAVARHDAPPRPLEHSGHVQVSHLARPFPQEETRSQYSEMPRGSVILRSEHDRFERLPESVPVDSRLAASNHPLSTEGYIPIERNEGGRIIYDHSGRPGHGHPDHNRVGRLEPEGKIVYGHHNDPQDNPLPRRIYVPGREDPSHDPFRPQFDGTHEYPAYERIEPARDNLPRRMENLAVDQPRASYRVYEEPYPIRNDHGSSYVSRPLQMGDRVAAGPYFVPPNSRPLDVGGPQGTQVGLTRPVYSDRYRWYGLIAAPFTDTAVNSRPLCPKKKLTLI